MPRHSHWLTRLDKPAQRVLIEAQRLARLPRRRLAAIGDDIGGHGRAKFAVPLIHILNRLLALVFRGQIEIDVRPLVAALAQKTLEEQFHSNRIDGRNFERIADGGVGGAAPALHQNAVPFAELNDVPDDEEVSGEAELGDQRQFMLHLLLRPLHQVAIVLRSVAPLDAFGDALAQKAVHRFAVRHRIARKLIAQIAQLEAEPRREIDGVLDGSGNIAEQRGHFARGAKMALAVDRQQPARLIEFDVIADRGKQILNLAVVGVA